MLSGDGDAEDSGHSAGYKGSEQLLHGECDQARAFEGLQGYGGLLRYRILTA